MNYGEDDVFTKEIVDIIKSITPSNSKVYILENFIVKDKTIRVTDLEDAIEIKGIDVPNGIYKIENDAVIQSSLDADNIDDYPKIGIIEDFETIKINKDFFKWAIEKTKNYVGKDDLRPVMTGINIQKKGDLLSITSTDAHLLATIDSAKYIKLNGVENDFSITVTPKNLFEAIKLMDSEEIEIAFTKDRYSDGGLKGSITVKFICDDIVYTTLSIEGKYPNYRAVIPYNNPKSLLMNMKDIKSIVNSVDVKSFISKNKKEADLIKIYGSELDGNINISIQATKGGYKQETKILGDKFLGKIGYDYDYETTNGNTCSLIMPVMKNEGSDTDIFTFNAVLFGKFLDNLDGDILELGFSEPSRAYIVGERNLFYTESKIKVKSKVKKQISKGIKVEEEHRETLEEIASGKISVDEAIEKTVQDHLAENPEYYEDLEKMELNELLDKLKKQGYNATIPANSNRINVIGRGKGYFKAKKQMAKSIIETLIANGYNAVSELDSDGYYDFYVYPSEQQDIPKMESENETYTYALTIRPFNIGTYPKENFIRLIKENYKFGLLEYSKPLSDRDIKHYSLAPVSELMKYDGKEYYYYEDFKAKINVIRDEDNTPFAKVTEFDENNDVVQEYTINANDFLQKIESLNYRFIDDSAKMEKGSEESIPNLIEGLKVLLEYAEGDEKTELENTIEGLKLLLEDDKFEKGGSVDNNSMFFEPSKSDEEEEKIIMENQFGKNI
jgi:hypothetical protein